MVNNVLPQDRAHATLVGRLHDPVLGPCVVHLRGEDLVDVTPAFPTVADLLDAPDPAAALAAAPAGRTWPLDAVLAASLAPGLTQDDAAPRLLAPCDVQAVKACGVTFARPMLERVIEERAKGDPARARAVRDQVAGIVGGALSAVKPGSDEAARTKALLQEAGYWSQYLEVGIGPDAEVFTKAQPLSAVGHGAAIGILRASKWNNPEPEVVLAVNSRAEIMGATLGNDVNLRDIEGRSALLLGKAKDNNASCALGPFIRLFDAGFGLDDVRRMELRLRVEGTDGFVLDGHSSMAEISRDPADLVRAAMGREHQYPDGMMLMLGTLFAPTEDRPTEHGNVAGEGFTHKPGDTVTIASASLGALVNTVRYADEAPPWTMGTRALMASLARRGLLPTPA